jgi:hypothetical protein
MAGKGSPTAIRPAQLLEMLRHRRSSRTGYIENKAVTDEQIELILYPRSRHNPKILGRHDAEIVGDRIA